MLSAIVLRELTSLLRRRRMLAMQSGLVIVFGLLVALRWPTDARVAMTGTRSQQVFQLIPANWWFLGIFSVLSLIVLIGQTFRISRPQ